MQPTHYCIVCCCSIPCLVFVTVARVVSLTLRRSAEPWTAPAQMSAHAQHPHPALAAAPAQQRLHVACTQTPEHKHQSTHADVWPHVAVPCSRATRCGIAARCFTAHTFTAHTCRDVQLALQKAAHLNTALLFASDGMQRVLPANLLHTAHNFAAVAKIADHHLLISRDQSNAQPIAALLHTSIPKGKCNGAASLATTTQQLCLRHKGADNIKLYDNHTTHLVAALLRF